MSHVAAACCAGVMRTMSQAEAVLQPQKWRYKETQLALPMQWGGFLNAASDEQLLSSMLVATKVITACDLLLSHVDLSNKPTSSVLTRSTSRWSGCSELPSQRPLPSLRS